MLSGDEHEHELALAEALALSGGKPCAGKLVRAERPIDIARAGYVLCGIELLASGADIAETCEKLRDTGLASDGFAIEVRRIPRGLKLHRREIANALALAVDGRPNLDDPLERFLTFVTADGLWFGRTLEAGEPDWRRLAHKPHDFSSALPAQAARAICNLFVRGGERVVDPCCGSGTLLIQAASLGANVTGYDISKKMMWATNKNLAHFGFAPAASVGDAAEVEGEFDVLLANVPYGRMAPTSAEKLARMVTNIAKLAPQGAIVAVCDLSEAIQASGGVVREVLRLAKFSVTRRIFIYERL